MERRFEIRKRQLLAECEVDPAVFEGAAERLAEFAQPFLAWLGRREQREYAQTYLAGLVSDVETKNVESIAYLHDRERHRLQAFVGQSKWEHQPLLDELAIQVGRAIGEPDAVLVFDPSGFPKSGSHSVGVQRQWCGRLGKIENCQVAVYLGYVSRREQRSSTCGCTSLRIGRLIVLAGESAACRQTSVFGRGMSWRWKCSMSRAACCRTAGSPGTMKWAVPRVFDAN